MDDTLDSGSIERLPLPVVGDDLLTADELRERGAACREQQELADHDHAAVSATRPSVKEFVDTTNQGRVPELVPLRLGKMAASPYAFFRGSAALMAADLAETPSSGLVATLCGDAHAGNFGLYGAQHGHVVMDINDFDEAAPGPWEWDLKRLAASLVLAGRESGASRKESSKAARHAARAYRRAVKALADMPFLRSWNALVSGEHLSRLNADELLEAFDDARRKAEANTSDKVVRQDVQNFAASPDDIRRHRFVADPPKLTRVPEDEVAAVMSGVRAYVPTLRDSRHGLLARYAMADVAHRIVGTGSIGLRSYVVLLEGNADEHLVLQVKQARPSVLSPYVEDEPFEHQGQRIVHHARMVQTSTDILMGWTTVDDEQYMVRQFRNRKGDIDPTQLPGDVLDDYGRVAGALLAKAHCRTLHPHLLRGYLRGDGSDLDDAIAEWAGRYADQTETDHAELVGLIEDGELEASSELA